MKAAFRNTALALAATGLAVPVAAADFGHHGDSRAVQDEQSWNHGKDRGKHKGWNKRGRNDRYDQRYYSQQRNYQPQTYYQPQAYYQPQRSYYAEPVYRDTRVWRDDGGQYRCQRRDGTTGLIVGAAAGALLGRSIDSRGDRTLGTILGAAAGAYVGKEVAQGGCR